MLAHERRLLAFHEVKVLPEDTTEMRSWHLELAQHRLLELTGGRLDGFNIALDRLLDPDGSLAVTVPAVAGNPGANPPTISAPAQAGLAPNANVPRIIEAKAPNTVLTGVAVPTDIRTVLVPASDVNIEGNHFRIQIQYGVIFTAPNQTLQVGIAFNEFNSALFTLVARRAGSVAFNLHYEAVVSEASDQVAVPTNGTVITTLRIKDDRGHEDFGQTILTPIDLTVAESAIDFVVAPSVAAITTTLQTSRIELLRGDC